MNYTITIKHLINNETLSLVIPWQPDHESRCKSLETVLDSVGIYFIDDTLKFHDLSDDDRKPIAELTSDEDELLTWLYCGNTVEE